MWFQSINDGTTKATPQDPALRLNSRPRISRGGFVAACFSHIVNAEPTPWPAYGRDHQPDILMWLQIEAGRAEHGQTND